jgi:zinc/manganese transport system permease protein
MTLAPFDAGIILPAFVAGLLVLATHVPMGQRVLARGIVFIDLAIAQIAGLGVIAADMLGGEPQGWVVQLAAVSAALLGALLLTYTEKRWPDIQEALIGELIVLAASGGLLLLANNPHGGERLKDLLVGQILWVSYAQLVPLGVLTAAIVALWRGLGERLGRMGFYIVFACAVTASVQLVGVYLVFASLIIPPLATRRWPERRRRAVAYGLGVAGYALGLALSTLADVPAGAMIVWCLALLGILLAQFAPATDTPG